MARPKLTDANYYSDEANWAYMSASQFKAFKRCPAAAMAELRGEWKRKGSSSALLVGSYVDAYFSGELEQFKAATPELFKRDGSLKAEFANAQTIAERLERDELARMLLAGKHQVIKTGKIGGVWYKAKFDSLLSAAQVKAICKKFPAVQSLVPFGGNMIVDLKTMRDFEQMWSDEYQERVSPIIYWGYDIQGAIYQALDKRSAPFVILGVTKETEPDIAAMYVPDEDLSCAFSEVEYWSPKFAAMKRGEIEPHRCEKCEYCKSTKVLSGIRNFREV